MYKAANGISLVMMNKIFQLREESHYTSKFVMIHLPGQLLRELILPVIRQIECFNELKKEIKKNGNQLTAHERFANPSDIPSVGFL